MLLAFKMHQSLSHRGTFVPVIISASYQVVVLPPVRLLPSLPGIKLQGESPPILGFDHDRHAGRACTVHTNNPTRIIVPRAQLAKTWRKSGISVLGQEIQPIILEEMSIG